MCRTIFYFIRCFTKVLNEVNDKKRRIKYFSERDKIRVIKSEFGQFNLDNDVIYDAHNVIFTINLK